MSEFAVKISGHALFKRTKSSYNEIAGPVEICRQKSEVMCMLLSDWILTGVGIFNLLLLTITLHQIKRVKKQTKEHIMASEDMMAQIMKMLQSDPKEKMAEEQETVPVKMEKPEALINAVLEEVFP